MRLAALATCAVVLDAAFESGQGARTSSFVTTANPGDGGSLGGPEGSMRAVRPSPRPRGRRPGVAEPRARDAGMRPEVLCPTRR